jgi:hypothetical protein
MNMPVRASHAFIDGPYRYTLWRLWDDRPHVVFIMLNPSTADAQADDPTIRRCMGFARLWGYGGICVVNLFAYRSTDPRALATVLDPVGPRNDEQIDSTIGGADLIVAAWGAHGTIGARSAVVRALVEKHRPLHHLGLTKNGSPRHPLYLRGDTQPVRWTL